MMSIRGIKEARLSVEGLTQRSIALLDRACLGVEWAAVPASAPGIRVYCLRELIEMNMMV